MFSFQKWKGFINGDFIGTDESRSNAFEVLFDGTTTIAGDLNINSDARLKANIISLGATLSKLLQIDGKTYTMKKDANHKKKIGLLAQDIEKVFPELVTETNDIKSVNYQGFAQFTTETATWYTRWYATKSSLFVYYWVSAGSLFTMDPEGVLKLI